MSKSLRLTTAVEGTSLDHNASNKPHIRTPATWPNFIKFKAPWAPWSNVSSMKERTPHTFESFDFLGVGDPLALASCLAEPAKCSRTQLYRSRNCKYSLTNCRTPLPPKLPKRSSLTITGSLRCCCCWDKDEVLPMATMNFPQPCRACRNARTA